MKMRRLILWSFLLFGMALFLTDQVLYRLWLNPQLKLLSRMPFYYNYLLLLPVVGVIVFFGFTLTSWKQCLTAALIFTISHQILDFFNMRLDYSGFFQSFALDDPRFFWSLRPLLMFCLYWASVTIVWYFKTIVQKKFAHFTSHASVHDTHNQEVVQGSKNSTHESSLSARVIYHVVPDPNGWLVKKGKAKKASSAHATKEEALRAASDSAKNHPLSQVVVHKASGIIASDRTYEYRHYKQKKRKKEVIKRIKKGILKTKRKKSEERLRRRKAAQLGIARAKRKKYRRSLAALKAARARKKK
jgi:hypothetical protein